MLRRCLLLMLVGLCLPALMVRSEAQPDGEAADSDGVLRVAFFDGSQVSLDPHVCRDPVSFRMISLGYETLYMWAPQGEPRLIPGLAKDFPTVSDDGLTVTIKLDTTAQFHNSACFGEDRTRGLKASDVVHSIKRLAVFGEEGMYWMAAGLIEGLDEYGAKARFEMSYETTNTAVAGLEAVDDETLVIKLNRPCGPLPALLAHPCFSVLPREAMDHFAGRLRARVVGTGPYRLHAVAPSQLYVFKRHAGYRADQTGPARVVFTQRSYWTDFAAGLNGGTYHEIPLWESYYERVIEDGKPAGELQDAPAELVERAEHGYHYLAFNMQDPLWGALDADGRALRRAVSLAFDRVKMLEGAGWDAGHAPQEHVFPAGMEFESAGRGLEFGQTDAEAAVKLLEGSKYKGGVDPATGKALTLSYLAIDPSGLRGDYARLYEQYVRGLRGALAALGIKLEVRYVDARRYRDETVKAGAQMFQAGWFLDYPEASNFLQLFWGANVDAEEEFTNTARYESPEFDKLYLQLMKLAPTDDNRAARREVVASMAGELAKDMPIIPLFHARTLKLRSTKVDWPKMPPQTYNDLRYTGEMK